MLRTGRIRQTGYGTIMECARAVAGGCGTLTLSITTNNGTSVNVAKKSGQAENSKFSFNIIVGGGDKKNDT